MQYKNNNYSEKYRQPIALPEDVHTVAAATFRFRIWVKCSL